MKKNLLILAMMLTIGIVNAFASDPTPLTEDSVTGLKCGDTVTIEATPMTGYKFVKWSDGVTDNPREVEVTAGMESFNFVAEFEAQSCSMNVTSSNEVWGTATVTGDVVLGAEVTLTATPESACFKFVKWSDGDTHATRTVTVQAEASANTYQAIFEQVNFSVTVKAQMGGKVTIAKNE